ncbi:MAG: aminopeptidase [Bacteroidia bacterium]|nr:aminopeptidase [Bacteroidia bacterium]
MIEQFSYKFIPVKELASTPVKNQYGTNTCWSFATVSFFESELLRLQNQEYNLSEMFIVRMTYPDKAEKYVRLQGKAVFGPGGQAHDVINVINRYGIVPENIYPIKSNYDDQYNQNEMDAVLQAMLKTIVEKKGGKITPFWKEAFSSVLDVYLGEIQNNFTFGNKSFTPITFKEGLKINTEDYIEITSYLNYSFYTIIDLEIPDNWSHNLYYNVPIDELIVIVDNAIANGYTVCWDGDISDSGFSQELGVAVIPEKNVAVINKEWVYNLVNGKEREKSIVQKDRQDVFDNQTTTDDHLMHIVGTANDEAGEKYYIIKNSWGVKNEQFNGKLYMSESYFRLNTIAIMIHKESLPKEIRNKLKIKP